MLTPPYSKSKPRGKLFSIQTPWLHTRPTGSERRVGKGGQYRFLESPAGDVDACLQSRAIS